MSYKLTLTREQELAFIEIGIRTVTERVMTNVPEPPAVVRRKQTKRRWTPAQRTKFRTTMKRLWADRRSKKLA